MVRRYALQVGALIPIAVIMVMVVLNALYVAAEFATVGARRSRVQEASEGGSGAATRLLTILHDPKQLDSYVAACQIGITLSSLVAGAYGQAELAPRLEPTFGSAGPVVSILIVLVAVTAVQVVLGELLPKTIALRYPERLAMATLPPMRFSRWLFRPLVALFNGSAFAVMRRLGVHVELGHAHVHSPGELAALYRASAEGGLIDAAEREMLAGVLSVERRLAREIMTPRRRLVTVSSSASVSSALSALAGSPHSRFVVIDDGVDGDDEVIGMVHIRDLFNANERNPEATVDTVTVPVLEVAELVTVPALWRRLRDEDQHCALVVNEYGVVAGLVTLEDALEEVLGEVNDEFDLGIDPIVVSDGRVSVRGEVLLTVLNERFRLDLPCDDVDTVGGLVWQLLGRSPVVGDEIVAEPDQLTIRVDEVNGRAVERVGFELPQVLA